MTVQVSKQNGEVNVLKRAHSKGKVCNNIYKVCNGIFVAYF